MGPEEIIDVVLLALGSKMRMHRRAGVENEQAERLRLMLAHLRPRVGKRKNAAFVAAMHKISKAIEREEYAAALKVAEGLGRK